MLTDTQQRGCYKVYPYSLLLHQKDKMQNPTIAVVIDQNLGAALTDILRTTIPKAHFEFIEDPTQLSDRTERRIARSNARQLLLSRRWDAFLSLYQEMILKPDELAQTRLPLNIHPSRPEIPGMYYDVGPLIPGSNTHGICGATLHFMTSGIDEGTVIRVLESEVVPDADYQWVRRQNQQFCVDQTIWLAQTIADAADVDSLDALLRETSAKTNRCWGEYISAKQRDSAMLDLHRQNPSHPVFRENKKFEKHLLRVQEEKA